ncbi:MAG: flavodoxin family protein [Halorientalis sp.]
MPRDAPLIVGIAGSIRNRAGLDAVEGVDKEVGGSELLELIENLEHRDIYHDDFLSEIQSLLLDLSQSHEQVITNSDALVLTALYGAKDVAEIEFHKLTDYVGLDKSYAGPEVEHDDLAELTDVLKRADGLILGSPVYFGDRSSLMHSFLNFAAEQNLLDGTVVGMVSCGSKRNGGQETTNVYALFENLMSGALIVGNGPKTCQYGGTGWGGDIGDVAEDEFGLETSLGTGLRVSQVAEIQKIANSLDEERVTESTPNPFEIGVLVTREKDGIVKEAVQNKINRLDDPTVSFNVVDFSDAYIQACIGCDVCPTPGKVDEISGDGSDYKCIIDERTNEERWQADDLQHLHQHIVGNDALLIAALDSNDNDIRDVYQGLLERTRYLRRDDWRLHNVPLAAFLVTDPGQPSTYPMKIMTSWMRHNTIVNQPIIHTRFDTDDAPIDSAARSALEKHYNAEANEAFETFVRTAKRLRAAAAQSGPDRLSYKATGYRNKILDSTEAKRI